MRNYIANEIKVFDYQKPPWMINWLMLLKNIWKNDAFKKHLKIIKIAIIPTNIKLENLIESSKQSY